MFNKLVLEVEKCLTNHIEVTLVTLQMYVTPVTFSWWKYDLWIINISKYNIYIINTKYLDILILKDFIEDLNWDTHPVW